MNWVIALCLFAMASSFARGVDDELPPPEEIEAMKVKLATLQARSFEAGIEICGYAYRGADGSIAFTEFDDGGPDGCTPVLPADATGVFASLHTHGSYDPTVPAEFPTVLDMDSDRAEMVNGYVATPGGRLWYIDSQRLVTHQICGPGCLPQDPGFHPGDDGEILPRYTHRALKKLETRLAH